MCGGNSSFGIDNHFQLQLYMNENGCQLEMATFFKKIFNSFLKGAIKAISLFHFSKDCQKKDVYLLTELRYDVVYKQLRNHMN